MVGCLGLVGGCTYDYDSFGVPSAAGVGSGGDEATPGSGGDEGGGDVGAGGSPDPGGGGASGGAGGAGGAGGSPPSCGDGVLAPGEECDDANAVEEDGCADCVVECPDTDDALKDPTTFHCYQRLPLNVDRDAARAACQALGPGTDLAAPSTVAEFDLVLPLATEHLWVGGGDAAQQGTWVWDNGEPWTYQDGAYPWASGQPNYQATEDCIQLGATSLAMFDVACTYGFAPLCERTPAGSR